MNRSRCVSLALGAAVVTLFCGANDTSATSVSLTLAPQIETGRLTIQGTTNLADGALISYQVTHELFGTDTDDPATMRYMAEGVATVQDGQYSTVVNVSSWPSGGIEVWAAFQTIVGMTAKQPADVIALYAEMGEKLTGDNVTAAGSMKRVELTRALRL